MSDVQRCGWPASDRAIRYHDEEWGVPVHEDRLLFEAFILGGAQAGLNWEIILGRREGYRSAFAGFDPAVVAAYGDAKIEELIQDPGIIRNRLKVRSAVRNARAFLAVQEEFGTFGAYLWRFVGGKPIVNGWRTLSEIPASTVESDALSRDLQQRGFNFVGSTICYAVMQGVGMVNDHVVDCFRHRDLLGG